ncbi:hypothetical protein G9U53_25100 [Rhodococcus sp. D-46]|nr:hypothetical protein [Rhodococcus sp. D-46]
MAEIKRKLRPVVAVSFEGRLITDLVMNSPLLADIAQRLPEEPRSMN